MHAYTLSSDCVFVGEQLLRGLFFTLSRWKWDLFWEPVLLYLNWAIGSA